MIEQLFTQRIFEMSVFKMFDIVRNKVSFLDKVEGISISKITDGSRGKYILPNDLEGFIGKEKRGKYYHLEYSDGSTVKFYPDESTNSLIFEFKANKNSLNGIRETVLNYIDYDYGKD